MGWNHQLGRDIFILYDDHIRYVRLDRPTGPRQIHKGVHHKAFISCVTNSAAVRAKTLNLFQDLAVCAVRS